jgi:Fe-S oxidoreductase
MGELEEVVNDSKVALCYSCGRCTAACPLTNYDDSSPRKFVEKYLLNKELDKNEIWACLTCGGCSVYCPSSVDFPEFIKALRADLKSEASEKCAHAGILHSIMRLMANSDMKQNRLKWVTPELEVKTQSDSEGDTMLFVGCAPYYDVYFDKWSPIEISRSAVKLLNNIGIRPVVLPNEVCCGHDLLWSGDKESFELLVKKNSKIIEDSNVKRIVFTCPECLMTFKKDYDLGGKVELMHMTELLMENIDKLKFKEGDVKVSYHDSCRMGRFLGLYDAPRKILEAIPGVELSELPHSKSRSVCCGTSCWLNCDWKSKSSQLSTLNKARDISEKLVTVCPKCMIHFSCTMDEKEMNHITNVEDILITIANSIVPNQNTDFPKPKEV